MSERSELLKKVLEAWDNSIEGRQYLEWLLKPEAVHLDGGDVLREAVLDVIEDDEQLKSLRSAKAAVPLEEIYAALPPEIAHHVREGTDALLGSLSEMKSTFRSKAEHLRALRCALGRDRLETLQLVEKIMDNTVPDEITTFHENFAVAEELAAKIAALSRTTVEQVDIAPDLRRHSLGDDWLKVVHERAQDSGESWFDYNAEKLDRYYAQQLTARLDRIVERASSLEPLSLEIKNKNVRRLFHEAHEAFLYSFDTGSIALCRSLVDHSLRDRLSVPQNERPTLRSMIDRAASDKLLDAQERNGAEEVEKAGNKIMHNMSNLRSTAQQVLDLTRIILNKLYGNTGDQ